MLVLKALLLTIIVAIAAATPLKLLRNVET